MLFRALRKIQQDLARELEHSWTNVRRVVLGLYGVFRFGPDESAAGCMATAADVLCTLIRLVLFAVSFRESYEA